MARGVSTVIPRAILATPYGTQRLLERFESVLASTAAGQGASLVGYDGTSSGLTGATLQDVVDEMQATSSLPAPTTLTIAAGAVTATQSVHAIDTQGGAATDDLDTISGTVAGFYVLLLANAARNVVVKHGTGNIYCPATMDITLDAANDRVLLYSNGTNLYAIGNSLDAILPVATTIAGGVIDATSSNLAVDTQAGDPSDDLDTITGTTAGQFLVLTLTNAAHNVVVKHGTGNIYCPFKMDITLDAAHDRVMLYSNGSNLYAIGQNLDAVVPVSLTIAGGIITASSFNLLVDTEAGAGTDNLDNISGTAAGQVIIMGLVNAAHNVVLRHGVGNIYCPGGVDITLDVALDRVVLVSNGTNLYVIGQELATVVLNDAGSVPTAQIEISAQPATGNTLTIGGDVYQFRPAAASVTNDTYKAVEIAGAGAAATAANLVLAINATYHPDQHPNIFKIGGVVPALADGTENVVADYIAGTTSVRIRYAANPGGAIAVGSPSIVLAENITDIADVWDVGNVNMNTLAGHVNMNRQHAIAQLTITAAMVTNTMARVDFPFAPVIIKVQIMSSGGVIRANGTDTFVIGNNGVLITLASGAAPNIQSTDIVTIEAWSASA